MEQIEAELEQLGVTKGQRLPDNRLVIYINRRKWMCMLYPDLAPLYAEDRAFWRSVHKRTRAGETVPQAEIEAHAKYFNEQEKIIIESYERHDR